MRHLIKIFGVRIKREPEHMITHGGKQDVRPHEAMAGKKTTPGTATLMIS